jgi:chemotaxis protein CheX
MPAIEEITEGLVRENIARALIDVFKTMLNKDIQPNGADDPAGGDAFSSSSHSRKFAIAQVVGSVGFIGDVNGLVYMHLDQPFANLCTGHILGLSDAETKAVDDESVNDAIGELTNMVVGGFKNRLCEAGYPCKLTIPSILRGHDFRVEPTSSARRHAYRFHCAGHQLLTDIVVKLSD